MTIPDPHLDLIELAESEPVCGYTSDIPAVMALECYLNGTLDVMGGYPAVVDAVTIPGWVAVASVDYNDRPSLALYRMTTLRRWYSRARRELRRRTAAGEEEATLYDCLLEEEVVM